MGFLKEVFADKEVLEASRKLLLTVLRVSNTELSNYVEVCGPTPEPELKPDIKEKKPQTKKKASSVASDTTGTSTTSAPQKDAPVVLPMMADDIEEIDDSSSEMEELPESDDMTLESLTDACKKVMNEAADLAVFRKDFTRCLQVYKVNAIDKLPKTEYKSFLALIEATK